MKQWTREERYRELKDASEIRDLYDRIQTSVYRQLYHVQPMTGLSSDPNGFALHEGKFHLCFSTGAYDRPAARQTIRPTI